MAIATTTANNAMFTHAIENVDVKKTRVETVTGASEAAAIDGLAALAPRPVVLSMPGTEQTKLPLASTALPSNPFALFPANIPGTQTSGTLAQNQNASLPQNATQWNATLQYYAYYSYMLANGGGWARWRAHTRRRLVRLVRRTWLALATERWRRGAPPRRRSPRWYQKQTTSLTTPGAMARQRRRRTSFPG